VREAHESGDTYGIPPGGTTPLGTLGFVSAGLELAEDVRAGRLPAPRAASTSRSAGVAAQRGSGSGARSAGCAPRSSRSARRIPAASRSAAGTDAIARAQESEGWELDPVYTGKALAALLDDVGRDPGGRGAGTLLFWNTMSSRKVVVAEIPAAFRRFAR
jgi:1-aminocyclopropane-1-carboxylate deaminase/D-cysteine desulfhydrase-like pyridoxal-dependent ACC family enzyme